MQSHYKDGQIFFIPRSVVDHASLLTLHSIYQSDLANALQTLDTMK